MESKGAAIVRIEGDLHKEVKELAKRMMVTDTYCLHFLIRKSIPETKKAMDMADNLLGDGNEDWLISQIAKRKKEEASKQPKAKEVDDGKEN